MRTLAAAAAVLALAAGCAGEEKRGDLPVSRQISATATFTPSVHIFAEPVVARLDVVVDAGRLDPDRVRVATKFEPYDLEGVVETRERHGGLTRLTYEWTLRCLRIACIPEILASAAGEAESGRGERRAFRLPPARLQYEEPGEETRVVGSASWPELVSVSRIKESDVPSFGFVFKTHATPLPEPDYRLAPGLLAAGLAAGALALLAFPGALVAGWLRRRRPPPAVVEERVLSPLERAVLLVEWARERENGAERREALEQLAVELDAVEIPELAESARALAWSPAAPAPAAADALLERVREVDGAPA